MSSAPARQASRHRRRRLGQTVALVGVAIAIGVMFLPVHASFEDDPLLRLQGFGRQAGPSPTNADCGSALSNLETPAGGGALYEVARDRACHDVSKRRAALAFAGGLLLVVVGFAGMVRVGHAAPAVSRPAPVSRLEPVSPPESAPAPEAPAEEAELADPADATP